MRNISVRSDSVNDTLRLGRVIAKHLRKSDIICLSGDLGSGKTVLTKGIAEGLGIKKNRIVSPTFVLIRQYSGTMRLFHFDFYRLTESKDIAGIGYEEYLYDDGVSVIEWPERLGFLMPEACLKIRLRIQDRSRRSISMSASGARYKQMLKEIHETIGA